MIRLLKIALVALGGSLILLLFVRRLVLYHSADGWLLLINALALVWLALALVLLGALLWRKDGHS